MHVCWICLLKDAHAVCLDGLQRLVAPISVWKALDMGDGELQYVYIDESKQLDKPDCKSRENATSHKISLFLDAMYCINRLHTSLSTRIFQVCVSVNLNMACNLLYVLHSTLSFPVSEEC